MKTLLIIGYVWPEPNSSAAGGRMMELIHSFLADHWTIVFGSAAALSPHRADLIALGVQEQPILLNDSSFDDLLLELKPDAVLFDRFFSEEQFGWRVERTCPKALRILDTEDLHSLRHIRHRLLKQAQKKLDNESARQSLDPLLLQAGELYAIMAEDDMTQREVAAIFRCDLSLMISRYEIDLLVNYFSVPPHLLHYCPLLAMDVPAVESLPAFHQRQHFISIGNFRHEPNWDAVLYLKHAIWPQIRAQLPHAELWIYGAYPPPKASQLHNPRQGFMVKGWASDALQVMQAARICLAPLRFGAGIKGKLLDAMRTATPSVTTAIGAESMAGDLRWGGAIENSAQAFAEAAVRLYNDEASWKSAQQQGLQILQQLYTQDDHEDKLQARIRQLQQNITEQRRQNFIGAMLRHHLHKSTEYMSQWIEAKNRNKNTE